MLEFKNNYLHGLIMKYFLLTLLTACTCSQLFAADGYDLKLKFNDYKDKKVFLAHYYGKPLPTVYKVDSTIVDDKGQATFHRENKIIGGLYIVLLEGNDKYFEFILDNGRSLSMNVTVEKLPMGVVYKNSPDNERFSKYVEYLAGVSDKYQQYSKELAGAKSAPDSSRIQEQFKVLSKEVDEYRTSHIKQNPTSLLSNIFKALEVPKVPTINKPDGTPDTDAQYQAYKKHFWDNFPFDDERIVYTPILGSKLQEYFSKIVLTIPDSFNRDADEVIRKARASKEVFKYTVHWLAGYTQESELMGMDACFVHLVENYYMKGDAFWLNEGTLKKYIDRARSIAPNVIGNVGPDIEMTRVSDNKKMRLNEVQAKYLLLVFWSPDCGHCEKEIPQVDSLIRAEGLDKKGLKVIGYNVDRDTVKWMSLIRNKKLDSWQHVYDPTKTSEFRSKYDVYGTPSIYLLDDKKIIRGKKLDHTNIAQVMKILEEEQVIKNEKK